MSATKCATCGKTAYPLESITAAEKTFHKICFKCEVCGISLSHKNFKAYQGKVYCFTHTPVERSSTGSDGMATQNALKAPKKVAEGLGTAQKGTGETPNVGIDTVASQTALKAPKAVAEGLGNAQKGAGGADAPKIGLDSIANQQALKAPKAVAEGLGNAHKGAGGADAPKIGLDSLANQQALKAPRAIAEGLGNVHKGDARTAPEVASFEVEQTTSNTTEEDAPTDE